jgi:hypothetical protein
MALEAKGEATNEDQLQLDKSPRLRANSQAGGNPDNAKLM